MLVRIPSVVSIFLSNILLPKLCTFCANLSRVVRSWESRVVVPARTYVAYVVSFPTVDHAWKY